MTKLYIRLATKLGESEVRHHEREMLVFSLLGCLIQLGGWCFPRSAIPSSVKPLCRCPKAQ